MPTETAPQPPVAAPAAVTPPAPPAAERPISSITGKPIGDAAHSLFKMLEESGDPMREEKPVDKPAAPAPVAAAPVAVEKPIKVSKKPAPKRPDLPVAAEAPATPAPAVPVATVPDAKWEDSLLEDEKAALEDARLAEKVDPKHKGLGDRMGKFFREQKAYLEAHPDADENDAGYKKILATQPSLSVADKRAISTARIKEEVSRENEGKFADLNQEIYVRDEEPKVKAEAQQIRQHLAFNALPKQMLDILKEKGAAEGVKALQKDYADELDVAGGLINTLVGDAEELLRITRVNPKTQRPLGTVAADSSHPKWEQHNRIAVMVNEACNDFQKTAPQSEQVRDGKWFVTREEWARIPAASRHQFWTFTNSDAHVKEMINRAMGWMPSAIELKLRERQEHLKARGYVRQRTEAPVAPVVPPVASTTAPSPRPSPSPAPNNTPAGQLTPGQALARRLSAEA